MQASTWTENYLVNDQDMDATTTTKQVADQVQASSSKSTTDDQESSPKRAVDDEDNDGEDGDNDDKEDDNDAEGSDRKRQKTRKFLFFVVLYLTKGALITYALPLFVELENLLHIRKRRLDYTPTFKSRTQTQKEGVQKVSQNERR